MKYRPMPDKMAGKLVSQTLLVRVTSDTEQIQSSDWPNVRYGVT